MPKQRAPSPEASQPDAAPAPAVAPSLPVPLDPALRAKLLAIRADPPPRGITRNRHYLVSNENQHHLYREAVADKGGIQIGVGAEQNYLLAGWARPEILILMDYDEWVADLNRVYGLIFERASSAAQFMQLWDFSSRRRVLAWIKQRWPEQKQHWKKVRAFQHGRAEVRHRLEQLRERHQRLGVACFLDDEQQYAYLSALWQTGRVLAIRGDLLQQLTLQHVAEFSRAARLPVRLLYLSNTEEYFSYDSGNFRRNMLALPYDEQSVVLHTRPYDGDYYRYVYQSGLNYQAWLRSGRVAHFCDLYAYSVPAGRSKADRDLLQVVALPEGQATPRKVACTPPKRVFP